MPAEIDGGIPEQRIVEQAARLPPGGAVTGWAALRLYGAAFFDGLGRGGGAPRPVPLAVGSRQIRIGRGAEVRRGAFPAGEVRLVQGVPCVPLAWALFEELRSQPFREAVVAMDMVSAAYLTSCRRQTSYLDSMSVARGMPRARAALHHARDGSASPGESHLRLVWTIDLGLPEPLLNQPVFTNTGNLLGVVDLFDPRVGLAGEYDGAVHRSAARHSRDVDRESRLRDAGIEVVRVTGPDLSRPQRVADRVAAAYRRAERRRVAADAWTLRIPSGWQPDPGVDDHLDHLEWLASVVAHEQGTAFA